MIVRKTSFSIFLFSVFDMLFCSGPCHIHLTGSVQNETNFNDSKILGNLNAS